MIDYSAAKFKHSGLSITMEEFNFRGKDSGAQTRIFQGRGGFLEKISSINISSATHERKIPQGKFSKFLLLHALKVIF